LGSLAGIIFVTISGWWFQVVVLSYPYMGFLKKMGGPHVTMVVSIPKKLMVYKGKTMEKPSINGMIWRYLPFQETLA